MPAIPSYPGRSQRDSRRRAGHHGSRHFHHRNKKCRDCHDPYIGNSTERDEEGSGQPVIAYKLFRCRVSEYQAIVDLDANANAVLTQHIKLKNEGWGLDYEVAEPAEPTFTKSA